MGGMGEAIARRVGVGHQVLLADVDEGTLDASAAALRADGLDVATQQVDVADPASVAELAEAAAARGPVRSLAHTAGLSPVQAPSDRIVDVDLLGVAHALEAFARGDRPRGRRRRHLVQLGLPGRATPARGGGGPGRGDGRRPGFAGPRPGDAATPTRGWPTPTPSGRSALLVQTASLAWGERQARLNSISPGVITTPDGRGRAGRAPRRGHAPDGRRLGGRTLRHPRRDRRRHRVPAGARRRLRDRHRPPGRRRHGGRPLARPPA